MQTKVTVMKLTSRLGQVSSHNDVIHVVSQPEYDQIELINLLWYVLSSRQTMNQPHLKREKKVNGTLDGYLKA